MNDINEKELITKIRSGDVSAFTKLVNQYSEQVLRLAYRIVSSREDAEDIAHKVFIKVYKGINQFRGDASFSSWLYTIVKNTCYSHLRKKRPEMVSLDEEADFINSISITYPENTHETIDTKVDFQMVVMECLKKLPPKYNIAIQLFFYQQLRYVEIAEILQIPLSTVKTHLHRALKLLRKEVLKNLGNYKIRKEHIKNELRQYYGDLS